MDYDGCLLIVQFKGSEPALVPPTGMAAHAADEVVEAIEMVEDPEAFETDSAAVEKGATYRMQGLPFPLLPPPPPPLPQHLYQVSFVFFSFLFMSI